MGCRDANRSAFSSFDAAPLARGSRRARSVDPTSIDFSPTARTVFGADDAGGGEVGAGAGRDVGELFAGTAHACAVGSNVPSSTSAANTHGTRRERSLTSLQPFGADELVGPVVTFEGPILFVVAEDVHGVE